MKILLPTKLTKNLVLKLNLNKNEYKNSFKLSQQNIKESYDEYLLMKCNQLQKKWITKEIFKSWKNSWFY